MPLHLLNFLKMKILKDPVFKTFRSDRLKLVDRRQNKYSLQLKTKEFGKYRNVEGEIELEVQYVPAFSEER